MKRKLTVAIIFAFLNWINISSAQNWEWAKGDDLLNQGGQSRGTAVVTDGNGSIYVAGTFSSSIIQFDSITLSNLSRDRTSNVFLVKYDPFGNVIWAKGSSGNGEDEVNDVETDSNGNVYIIGSFANDTITFGNIAMISGDTSSALNLFIVKYDSNGNELWSFNFPSDSKGLGLATDLFGNIYFTGQVLSTQQPFTGAAILRPGMILVKFDSNGNLIWLSSGRTTTKSGCGQDVSVDIQGNVFVTGWFDDSLIMFDQDSTINTLANHSTVGNSFDMFVIKFDSIGNYLWAKNPGSSNDEKAYDITCDLNGNAYITGYVSSNYGDIYMAKFDSSGNLIWDNSIGGPYAEFGKGISCDNNGYVYLTGGFKSPSISFGNTTLINFNQDGYDDVFIVKCDSLGNIIWAESNGDISYDTGNAIALDKNNHKIFITGQFSSVTITFGNSILNNSNFCPFITTCSEMFVAKSYNNNTANIENQFFNKISIYPNPNKGTFTIQYPFAINNSTIDIFDSYGRKIKTVENISGDHLIIDSGILISGIYFIHLSQEGKPLITDKLIINE